MGVDYQNYKKFHRSNFGRYLFVFQKPANLRHFFEVNTKKVKFNGLIFLKK